MRAPVLAVMSILGFLLSASASAQEAAPPEPADPPTVDPEGSQEEAAPEAPPPETTEREVPPSGEPEPVPAEPRDPTPGPSGEAASEDGPAPGEDDGPIVELPDDEDLAVDAEPAPVVEDAAGDGEPPRILGALPIGGYGELHYNLEAPAEGDRSSVLDLHRMVLFVGHRFDFGLAFQLELEVEHAFVAGEDSPGEVAIEQAYVEYPVLGGYLGVRAGIVLVPMGIINETHEPPTFNGVERPMVARSIIPTTWREGGIGLYGELAPGLTYQAYLMTGLDAGGFSLGSGLRGGRQHVAKARFDGVALAGRLQYSPSPWLTVGVAGYWSQTGRNARGLNASCDLEGTCTELDADVPVGGGAADLRLRWRGIEARGMAAVFSVADTLRLRAAVDDEGEPAGVDVGSVLFGAYVELGYDVLHLVGTRHQLVPFVRYEYYDTTLAHDDPDIEGSRATHDIVLGLGYRPIREVAFKLDVILRNPGDGDVLFNAGVGWMF